MIEDEEKGWRRGAYLMLGTLKLGNNLEGLPLFDLLVSLSSCTLRDAWGHRKSKDTSSLPRVTYLRLLPLVLGLLLIVKTLHSFSAP